jgi:hypothetical protein
MPCLSERLSTPSDKGYAPIMLRGSTTLKTTVEAEECELRQIGFLGSSHGPGLTPMSVPGADLLPLGIIETSS